MGHSCPSCSETFDTKRGMQSHHAQSHGESLVTQTVTCSGCGDEFTVYPFRLQQSKGEFFCSTQCRKTGEYVDCEWCGERTYRNKKRLDRFEHHFCSPDCLNEWQRRNKLTFKCKTCGETFTWSPSRTDDHDPTYCSIECRDEDEEWVRETTKKANQALQNSKEPTDIEKIGGEILDSIGIEYKEQVIIGDKFCVDVLVPSADLIIQWDGDYWHCHPKYDDPDERQLRRQRIDESQNAYFEECGYDVLRFWGSDIRQNREQVQNEISEVIA